MMMQISSQGILNRFSIERLYISDEYFHHHHNPHKNKNNDDHKDDNNIHL